MSHLKLVKQSEKSLHESLGPIEHWIKQSLKSVSWDPKTSTIYKWGVYNEKKNGTFYIKREIRTKDNKKTWQRLNIKFYSEFKDDKRKVEDLAIMLNGFEPAEERSKEKWKKHRAYLGTSKKLDDFYNQVRGDFVNKKKKDINNRLAAFYRNGYLWFTGKTSNPLKWKSLEKEWGRYLLNTSPNLKQKNRIFPEGEIRAKSTLEKSVWIMNKYMEYLHSENPDIYPKIELNPITRSQYRLHEQERERRKVKKQRKRIEKDHLKIILKALRKKGNERMRKIILCYEFGLRRSEALAISIDHNLFEESLLVFNQLEKIDRQGIKHFSQTKTRKKREIPWDASVNLSPDDICDLIEESVDYTPDTITRSWKSLMKELNLSKYDYDIHCLRHTAAYELVNAERLNPDGKPWSLKAIMEILGHSSIATTNKYIQSKKTYSKKKFIRKKKAVA